MSTQAQITANQMNAQRSTGPTTAAGKAKSSQNRFRHGLTGPFVVLEWESREDYQTLLAELFAEHQPTTLSEEILVEDMAQSHWLRKRALNLQHMCFRAGDMPGVDEPKDMALYLRYQTTHDRAFYKALNQLLKLRAEKRKEENGFVSQERRAADEARRQLSDQRRQAHEKRREAQAIRSEEMHQARLRLVQAQSERQQTETKIAQLVKMPRLTPSNGHVTRADAA